MGEAHDVRGDALRLASGVSGSKVTCHHPQAMGDMVKAPPKNNSENDMTRKINGKVQVLLSSYQNLDKDGMPTSVAGLTYTADSKWYIENGYTLIGEATIDVTVVEKQQIIDNKIQSLRAEAKAIQAEATMKATKIDQKIRDLLSIGFDGSLSTDELDIPF